MSSTNNKKVSPFLIQWIIANAIGFAIGGAFGPAFGENVGFSLGKTISQTLNFSPGLQEVLSSTTAGLLMSLLSSGIIGIAQWFVIRNYILRAQWWIPASMIGAVLGSTINSANGELLRFIVGDSGNPFWVLLLGGILISPLVGLVSGLFEWAVLRIQLPRAGWWIVIRAIIEIAITLLNIVGAIFSFILGTEIGRYICNGGTQLFIGAIFGIMTGFVLSWMINQRNKDQNLMSFESENNH
jgi:hypothetical protein